MVEDSVCLTLLQSSRIIIIITLTLGKKKSTHRYFDNKTVCDLIEGKRPAGVFVILDDTCKTMHAESSGVDDKFLQKLNTYQNKHKHYVGRSKVFTIKHYAGDVRLSLSLSVLLSPTFEHQQATTNNRSTTP